MGRWDPHFIAEQEPSIEFLELYALTVAVTAWFVMLGGGNFCIYCDNQAVMHMVNNLALSCMQCMKLLRVIALQGIQFNRRLKVKFIKSCDNVLADALSRHDFKRFWSNAPQTMKPHTSDIPDFLTLVSKVWDSSFDCWNVHGN